MTKTVEERMTRKMDGHELECALAAYAMLIERTEGKHGKHSTEAKELRHECQQLIKASKVEE